VIASAASNEVSLNRLMKWLIMAGIVDRSACGRITKAIIRVVETPRARDASYCPTWTPWRPPRTISAT
jgi:hypothetical protein